MHRVLFVVNELHDVRPTQTTAMLMRAALRAGHTTWVSDVAQLSARSHGGVQARALRLRPEEDLPALCAQLTQPTEPLEVWPIDATARVLLRTNPARDPRRALHQTALGLLQLAQAQGAAVYNDPTGLMRAQSKLYLCGFPPQVQPETLVSADPAELRAYVLGRTAPTILKPLEGTRGRDVFKIDPQLGAGALSNLNALIDVLCRDGVAIAQAYVPEAAAGDMRVVLLDGEPVEREGHIAAIRRVPKPGDHRSNLHAGGHAEPAELSARQRQICALVGPKLRADGIRLAGLDFIGAHIIEINVFSTGGLRDAERFSGQDFSGIILRGLLGDADDL